MSGFWSRPLPVWSLPLILGVAIAGSAVFVEFHKRADHAVSSLDRPAWTVTRTEHATTAQMGPRFIRMDNASRRITHGMGYLEDTEVCLMMRLNGARVNCSR